MIPDAVESLETSASARFGAPVTLEGRVEICHNRAWGTVCTSGFAQTEADVVCSQLDRPFIADYCCSNTFICSWNGRTVDYASDRSS